jgi:hypothetical protein
MSSSISMVLLMRSMDFPAAGVQWFRFSHIKNLFLAKFCSKLLNTKSFTLQVVTLPILKSTASTTCAVFPKVEHKESNKTTSPSPKTPTHVHGWFVLSAHGLWKP